MERVKLKPRPVRPITQYRYRGTPAEEANRAKLREWIDKLFRSGKVDKASGLPAFLDRKRWAEMPKST